MKTIHVFACVFLSTTSISAKANLKTDIAEYCRLGMKSAKLNAKISWEKMHYTFVGAQVPRTVTDRMLENTRLKNKVKEIQDRLFHAGIKNFDKECTETAFNYGRWKGKNAPELLKIYCENNAEFADRLKKYMALKESHAHLKDSEFISTMNNENKKLEELQEKYLEASTKLDSMEHPKDCP